MEIDDKPLQRASFINQARVHNGYHYPRSVSTASKSAHYYERFVRTFHFLLIIDSRKYMLFQLMIRSRMQNNF